MRDPKRIERILRLVQIVWEKNPDLRLGQLLIWLESVENETRSARSNRDLFYFEDVDLEHALKERIETDLFDHFAASKLRLP